MYAWTLCFSRGSCSFLPKKMLPEEPVAASGVYCLMYRQSTFKRPPFLTDGSCTLRITMILAKQAAGWVQQTAVCWDMIYIGREEHFQQEMVFISTGKK